MSVQDVLAGPILRKTTLKAVYVWIALDKKIAVNGRLYDSQGVELAKATPASCKPIKLGENIFVYLLEIMRATPLIEDCFYTYDIEVGGRNLSQLGLTTGHKGITYGNQSRPGFYLPKFHNHILQASCRRPHAALKNGKVPVFDQSEKIDRLLAASVNKKNRPSMLFLSGDQIYADDVALALQLKCSELGEQITGVSESMPYKGNTQISPHKAKKYAQRNKQWLTEKGGFTTGAGENHLMTFGEFAAMYLMVWGWKADEVQFKTYKEIESRVKLKSAKHGRNRTSAIYSIKRADYNRQVKVLNGFFEKVHHLRRVMANVPTYMMFDDHDVTDDWNLSEKNSTALKSQPLSRRLATNALAACWGFQFWGNDPERFGVKKLKQPIQSYYGLDADSEQRAAAVEKVLLDQQFWQYTVPVHPPVVVLDTRTRREFLSKSKLALMNDEAFKLLDDDLNRLMASCRDSKNLILLSSTPVYGFSAIEKLQLKFDKAKLKVALDREPWIASKQALARLVDTLAQHTSLKHIVVLSGDVHYGFSRFEQIFSRGRSVNLYQCTSSASCNTPSGSIGRFGMKVLENWSRFIKVDTPYLVAKEKENDFIISDTNIGLLNINEKGPIASTLYCHDASERKNYQRTFALGEGKRRLLTDD